MSDGAPHWGEGRGGKVIHVVLKAFGLPAFLKEKLAPAFPKTAAFHASFFSNGAKHTV